MPVEIDEIIQGLSRKYEDFNWWIPGNLASFDKELAAELPKGHPLLSRNLTAVAKNDRNDEVLFRDDGGFYLVHLTWNEDNSLPFPWFKRAVDATVERFLEDDYLKAEECWGWADCCEPGMCDDPIVGDACSRGATVRVVDWTPEWSTVKYKDAEGRIPTSVLIYRPAPLFSWGDHVEIAEDGTTATVSDVCWRYKDSSYHYYLESMDGDPIKRRYLECELRRPAC